MCLACALDCITIQTYVLAGAKDLRASTTLISHAWTEMDHFFGNGMRVSYAYIVQFFIRAEDNSNGAL